MNVVLILVIWICSCLADQLETEEYIDIADDMERGTTKDENGLKVYKLPHHEKRNPRPQSDFPGFDEIIASVEEGSKWEDPDPPVWGDKVEEKYWIMPDDTWTLFPKGESDQSTLTTDDFIQGALGDCWFIAAISMVSLHPPLFDNFISDYDEDKGVYCFSLYPDGELVTLCVDEQIPVLTPESKVPVFVHSRKPGILWPTLAEKALAKLLHSYTNLKGGWFGIGVQYMTGKTDRAYRAKDNPALKDPDNLWKLSKTLYQYGFLAGVSFVTLEASNTPEVVEGRGPYGLVSIHAYGIMNIFEFPDEQVRLFKLRNPWGKNEKFTGDWCDGSSLWEEHPNIAKHVKYQKNSGKMAGIFFMSVEQMAEVFDIIEGNPVFESPTSLDENYDEEDDSE
eukprot:NODE_3786_length_1287_cov_49.148625_g3316_i0.p1 GENE.NODE_3786_length_1287_cov_49.148625_g3316_i0~~NODE_3786_length_1287_cov_49.148625_g3316_i0.p1  ORF type:complete len:394 (+),score=96.20 NODE_3786_length_1287_cov_49.148625_g3316_i0:52-1233(+)